MVNPVEPFQFPKNASPVDAIAQRLQSWQTLASSLAEYTTQLADLNRSNSASNDRLAQIVKSCSVKPSDDAVLTMLPGALLKLHSELNTCNRHSASSLSKAATQLRNISSDAQQRADNIRTYNQHFSLAQQVKEAQTRTKSEISHYQSALNDKDSSGDPYVLKSRVDRALVDQINLENKLLENYHTVQTLGAQYDSKIVAALNKAVREIESGFAASGTIQVEFCKSLKDNIFAPHADDFDQFIASNKDSFITEDVAVRDLANARYEGQYSSNSKAVRKGTLERRTKYLHSFVPAEYVLTLSSLYEIKDGHRTLGIDLSDAELPEDHKHSTDDRFVLRGRQQGSSSGKHHTWVFRSDDARKWAADLKKILSAPPGQRAVAVFGSDTYDPEAEASTLSEKGTRAQVPSSLPANAPPADTLSTAAVASGQSTPKDGNFGAGALGAGAAGATGAAVAGDFEGTSNKKYDAHGKNADPTIPVHDTEFAGVAGQGSSKNVRGPDLAGHSSTSKGAHGQTHAKDVLGPDLAGQSASKGSHDAHKGAAIGAGALGAGATGAAVSGHSDGTSSNKYDPHAKHDVDPAVPVHDTEFAGVTGQGNSKNIRGPDVAGTKGAHGSHDAHKGALGAGALGAGATGAAVSGHSDGTSSNKYDPHSKNDVDPAVPVHDTEFAGVEHSKDAKVPGVGVTSGASSKNVKGPAIGSTSGSSGSQTTGIPNATAGSIGAAGSGGAVSGGFEGTSNEPYDPHGKSNDPIVPIHDAHFGSDSGVSPHTREVKPTGAVDVSAPVEGHSNKTQLGYLDTSKKRTTNANPDIIQPTRGDAYKPVPSGAATGAGVGAGAIDGAAVGSHEHNKSANTEALEPSGCYVDPSSNPRDSTTSSHYSKSGSGAGIGAGVGGFTSGAYDSDSASSVSDVEYYKDSPTGEVAASTSSIVPPAHSAAWQAQQDLAAFDKKVEERDSSAIAPGDADSQFSYDKKHRASTYTGEDYKPSDVLPPHVERKLTQTYHKYEDSPLEGIGAARTQEEINDPSDKHFERRRSSISLNRKPSRSATASYGGTDELKPLTNPDKSQHGKAELFFADELPASTSGNPTVPGPVGGTAKFM